MAQRTSAKQWTTAEDECLVQAVRTYGEDTESWKQIAAAVPGRTNKACRKRWKHSLHPSIKKSNWNVEEDELLLDLHMKHPGRWALIASHIPGRTDDACAKRYCEALDPKLNKNEWTPNEDEILLEAYDRLGSAWSKVGEELGRSGLGCRNRWRLLERRRKAVVRKAEKAKGGVSGSETRKRKRGAVSDPQLPDEEGADFEDQEPGPNKSRLSPAIRRWESSPPIPSGSGSRPPPNPSPVLAVQNPVDVPSHNTTTHTNPHTSIDPSIISMALGKCGCGCASGANPCMCSSITPALSFDLASSSIDWNELFPYLHAELPNVFVEPLLHWDVGNSQQKAYMQAISTLLAENAEGGQCRCQIDGSRGCCSTSASASVATGCFPGLSQTITVSEPCCSGRQQAPASCCSTSTSAVATRSAVGCCSNSTEMMATISTSCCGDGGGDGEQLSTQPMDNSIDAEAAKLVLDYASTFIQRHRSPHSVTSTSDTAHPKSVPSPKSDSSSSLGPSCQAPASQVLVGIINRYQHHQQQQRSHPSSSNLQNVPLPPIQSGGGCRCGGGEDETSSSLLQLAPGIEPEPYQSGSGGGCCGPPMPLVTLDHSTYPQQDTSKGPFLNYLPGCPCGCNTSYDQGAESRSGGCSCGCIGVCLCGTEMATSFAARLTSGRAAEGIPAGIARNAVDLSHYQSNSNPIAASSLAIAQTASGETFLPQSTVIEPMNLPAAASSYQLKVQSILLSVVPGCGCGCGEGVSEGSCECGCVGVCLCSKSPKMVMVTGMPDGSTVPEAWSLPAASPSHAWAGACLPHHGATISPIPRSAEEIIVQPCCASTPTLASSSVLGPPSVLGKEGLFSASQTTSGLTPTLSIAPNASTKTTQTSLSPTSTSMSTPAELSIPTPNTSSSSSSGLSAPTASATTAGPRKSQARLSGSVAAPVSAYACGHPSCWDESSDSGPDTETEEVTANARMSFRTSGELLDHRRTAHGVEDEAEGGGGGNGTGLGGHWLFRCALRGCGKGWKSINGIQYHLQLSKAHFQSALNEEKEIMDTQLRDRDNVRFEENTTYSAKTNPKTHARRTSPSIHTFVNPPGPSDHPPMKAPKSFACTHEGCHNTYKQAAGLKYHLVHGHATTRPVQLSSIPPALSRKICVNVDP